MYNLLGVGCAHRSNSDHQDDITFLVGDPYKPSFATVTGRGDTGDNPRIIYQRTFFLKFPWLKDQLGVEKSQWFSWRPSVALPG